MESAENKLTPSNKSVEWWKSQAEGWQERATAAGNRADYFAKQWEEAKSRCYGWRLAFISLVTLLLIYWLAVPHHPVDSGKIDSPPTVAE